ncbi:MAG: RNA pyrophosphohydrolase [Chlamydiae bacterium]|nr:RNA pyrophosphohydrolase [Chlamydiota bacterium]
MERQFTTGVYVIDHDRVLLIYHRKIQKWLPPGGHIDPNETPPEAAKREVFEETGLEVELIHNENIWIERWNATSFERPYMCLLEEIPEHNGHPAHQHIDFIYLSQPINGTLKENPEETAGIRWFTLEEVEQLEPDVDIFLETVLTIRGFLQPAEAVKN